MQLSDKHNHISHLKNILMIKPYNNYTIFSMNYFDPDIVENALTKTSQYTINVANVLANKIFVWNEPESSVKAKNEKK